MVLEPGHGIGVPDGVVQPCRQLERQLALGARDEESGQLSRTRERVGGRTPGAIFRRPPPALGDEVEAVVEAAAWDLEETDGRRQPPQVLADDGRVVTEPAVRRLDADQRKTRVGAGDAERVVSGLTGHVDDEGHGEPLVVGGGWTSARRCG